MKTNMTVTSVPTNGILALREGNLLRLFFDFEQVPPTEENPDADQYSCEGVDVCGSGYGDIVSAIVNDRYPRAKWDAVIANYQEALDSESEITAEKRAEYLAEYEDFQTWRKTAKEIANTIING